MTEQIAAQLVARAQELLDDKVYLDAKQLAVEAKVKSPTGPSAQKAKIIIETVNQILGIKEDVEPPPIDRAPDLKPIEDPTLARTPEPPPQVDTGEPVHDARTAAAVHGAIFAGLLGATVGSFFDRQNPAGGAVPVGLAAGLAGGLFLPNLARKYHADEAQVRTIGSGTIWGGVIGGLMVGTSQGANGGTLTAPAILVGASVGSAIGGLGGFALAKNHTLTRGDVALVDTFAGIGTAGGLTIGMLMQPAQREAYSLNAALGAGAGVAVGLLAAPKTNTTPNRMLRVAGLAAAGGAAPFLLYAGIHDKSSTADERVTGLLSTAGLVGGAWLGFYLTRNFEVGRDLPEGQKPAEPPPPGVVGRTGDGHWQVGTLALSPLSPALAPQHGMTLTLVGGSF